MQRLSLLLLGITLSSSVVAMEKEIASSPVVTASEQKLNIANATNEPVTITWQLSNQQQASHFILQGGEKKDLGDFDKLTKFLITPYGKYKQLISREFLGLESQNYASDVLKAVSDKTMDISVAIEPATQKTGWFGIASKVLPYTVKISRVTHYPFPKEFLTREIRLSPLSALPRVKKAIDLGETVVPRYVFGLSDQASLADLAREYKRLQDQLEPVTLKENRADATFAQDLLAVIDSAYTALKSELDFDQKMALFKNKYKA